jgi:hypothetical protein
VSLPSVLPSNEEDRQKNLKPIPATQIAKSLFRIWDCPPQASGEPFDRYNERVSKTLVDRYTRLIADFRKAS